MYQLPSASMHRMPQPRNGNRPVAVLLISLPLGAFALGTWQVYRRRRKLNLIADATHKLDAPPLTVFEDVMRTFTLPGKAGDMTPVRLFGRFDTARSMLIGPRQYQGKQGYHLIRPFHTSSGSLLVNQGWIAKDSKSSTTIDSVEPHILNGLLNCSPAVNSFTPANSPATQTYYYVNIVEMSQACGTSPVLIDACLDPDTNIQKLLDTGQPVGRERLVTMVNNHTQYIFTWYALSLATALMSITMLRKNKVSRLQRAVHKL